MATTLAVTVAGAPSTSQALAILSACLETAGARTHAPLIALSDDRGARRSAGAADAPVVEGDAVTIRAALSAAETPVDWCVQPSPGSASHTRAKALLVCDMDSTIIGCECIDELADMAGVKDAVSAVTEKAMRGEIGFEDSLRARTAQIAGLPREVLARTYAERVRLNPGAQALVASMKARGAHCALVSGGFTEFADRVAADVGFDRAYANTLEFENDRLTGAVRPPILGRDAKRDTLMQLAGALSIAPDQAIAVGDGANDLAMMEIAGLSVAYKAKPVVVAAAHGVIVSGDLRSVLRFQGFTDADMVEPVDDGAA